MGPWPVDSRDERRVESSHAQRTGRAADAADAAAGAAELACSAIAAIAAKQPASTATEPIHDADAIGMVPSRRV